MKEWTREELKALIRETIEELDKERREKVLEAKAREARRFVIANQ